MADQASGSWQTDAFSSGTTNLLDPEITLSGNINANGLLDCNLDLFSHNQDILKLEGEHDFGQGLQPQDTTVGSPLLEVLIL